MARASRGRKAGSGAAPTAAGGAAQPRNAPPAAYEGFAPSTGPHFGAFGGAAAAPAARHDAAAFGAVVAARPSFQCYIDERSATRITGWIWNPLQPEQRITVEVIDGDTRLARVLADRYRADLRQAGIGDGRHAFDIPLGPALLPRARHVLQLRCGDTGTDLPGSPIIIERDVSGDPAPEIDDEATSYAPEAANAHGAAGNGDATATTDVASAAASRHGDGADRTATRSAGRSAAAEGAVPEAADDRDLRSHIDFADWTGVKGWVWYPDEPEKRVVLELLDGETLLATVTAGEYRADLEQVGIGDGRHGFSVPFSETLLPLARHVLNLRVAGTEAEIPPFPLVLTRDQVGLDPSVMRFILGNVTAEAGRAQKAEDLGPLITNLVQMLDQALSYSAELAGGDGEANAAELISAADLAPQTQTLIDSMQWNYPRISLDIEKDPVVSIIIPVFNKFELTYACVKSIVDHGARIPFEIVIVDDCSRDETLFAGFAFGRGVRIVRSETNAGFIRSCNSGFEAARGEYVVFLNNDTEVKAHWLDELYQTMQDDPTIGIAGSKLLYPDGSLQECGGIIWRLGDGWNWGRNQPADDPRFSYMRDSDYVSGAALMIKASVFAELGKFDEYYLPAYYEDTDLCFRVRQLGYRVVVQPTSEVVHFEGASAGTSTTGTGMKRFQAVNHRKFFERWRDVLATHRFNGELPELEAERDVRQRALFIDDSVPEPDKDAGSNAALQHMLSLRRLGYKVTFIPADNMARIEPYTTDLQRRGIECLYHPFFFSVEDVFRKQKIPFDLIYLHRYSNASKYAGMIRQHFPKARIVYNVADLHFLRMQRQAEINDDVVMREKAEQFRRLELGAMSFVDCVIVHSAAEAELLKELAPDIAVEVIAWTVPLRELTRVDAPKPGIAFIGGYNHPPNIDAAKWAVQSVMPALRKRVRGVELLLVGSHMPGEVSSLAARDVVPLGYVPSLDSVLARVRLTIAPLRFGAGLKGKVLESMAAGVPCVMTTVAAEGIDLPDDLKSLVADDPDALAQRIAALCRDDREYNRVVEGCKAFVAAHFSVEQIDARMRDVCGVAAAAADEDAPAATAAPGGIKR